MQQHLRVQAMKKRIRLAVTALTGTVIAGNEDAAGTNLTEFSRQDVTSDFMKALIDKADYHGGQFDIVSGGDKWLVTVTKVAP